MRSSRKKPKQPVIQTELSKRHDGKVNVWRRLRGKFGWTDWIVTEVKNG